MHYLLLDKINFKIIYILYCMYYINSYNYVLNKKNYNDKILYILAFKKMQKKRKKKY